MLRSMSIAATVVAAVFFVFEAQATPYSVSGTSGPWDANLAGNPHYSDDAGAPLRLGVTPGSTITIQYIDGLTASFCVGCNIYDARGAIGSIFGSGDGFTGQGFSGNFFPSHTIDPGNTGVPPIYLNALTGAFVDNNGLLLQAFAPIPGDNNTPDPPNPDIVPASLYAVYSFVVPAGAAYLQLGVNDDIFTDNSGALNLDITGVTPLAETPLPGALPLFASGLGALGLVAHRRRRKAA